jgi:hypothetical protein
MLLLTQVRFLKNGLNRILQILSAAWSSLDCLVNKTIICNFRNIFPSRAFLQHPKTFSFSGRRADSRVRQHRLQRVARDGGEEAERGRGAHGLRNVQRKVRQEVGPLAGTTVRQEVGPLPKTWREPLFRSQSFRNQLPLGLKQWVK